MAYYHGHSGSRYSDGGYKPSYHEMISNGFKYGHSWAEDRRTLGRAYDEAERYHPIRSEPLRSTLGRVGTSARHTNEASSQYQGRLPEGHGRHPDWRLPVAPSYATQRESSHSTQHFDEPRGYEHDPLNYAGRSAYGSPRSQYHVDAHRHHHHDFDPSHPMQMYGSRHGPAVYITPSPPTLALEYNSRLHPRSHSRSPLPSTHHSPLPSTHNSPLPSTHNSPLPSKHNSLHPSAHTSPPPSADHPQGSAGGSSTRGQPDSSDYQNHLQYDDGRSLVADGYASSRAHSPRYSDSYQRDRHVGGRYLENGRNVTRVGTYHAYGAYPEPYSPGSNGSASSRSADEEDAYSSDFEFEGGYSDEYYSDEYDEDGYSDGSEYSDY